MQLMTMLPKLPVEVLQQSLAGQGQIPPFLAAAELNQRVRANQNMGKGIPNLPMAKEMMMGQYQPVDRPPVVLPPPNQFQGLASLNPQQPVQPQPTQPQPNQPRQPQRPNPSTASGMGSMFGNKGYG